ncbi:MAG: hypothetical protein OXB89_06520 [Anaerolineaceae bacterium]|nr:hypothetical protein [Anaerolineaceae bacterium]
MAVGERLAAASGPAATSRREGNPELTPAFTWTALALGVWVLLGAVVDIHAHNHGQVDETFFTPFHLLMYSGVAANGLFYVVMQYRYVGRGHRLLQALPRAYLLSFAGVLLFGVGGVFDLVWHELFGFEAGIDALVSPSHLLLVLSGLLFMSGPLRSFLAQGAPGQGWMALFPPLTAALMALTLATLFTGFNNVWSQVDRYVALDPDSDRKLAEAYTVATALIPAALMTGTLLFLRRRMPLPFGAVTYLLFTSALIMFYIRLEDTAPHAPVLLAPLLAGLVGDWLLARPPASPPLTLRLFAFAAPFIMTFGLFVILQLGAGIWWSTHMWVGVSFMAGAVGPGLAGLVKAEDIAPMPSRG